MKEDGPQTPLRLTSGLNHDIDNDTLQNSLEAPDRWDTNPVDHDSDGDKLPDGWEVRYSEEAIELGLVDNNTLNALGSRGPWIKNA